MHISTKLGCIAMAAALPLLPARAETIYALTSEFCCGIQIRTFDSAAPGTILYSGQVAGVMTGDRLLGLDLRPSNRKLYSVGTSGSLYEIVKNASGSDWTAVSSGTIIGAVPTGQRFGVDFNPTVDRLRLVSEANQNLRINPNAAPPAAIVDGMLTLYGSSTVDIGAVAYTNSRAGATTTTLYGIDAATDSLVRSTNANAGTYTNTNTLGAAFAPLGFGFGALDRLHFDISGGSGTAFLAYNDRFYTVDLASGAARFVGAVGVPDIAGITAAAVPEPGVWAMLISGFGMIGTAMRRRTRALAA